MVTLLQEEGESGDAGVFGSDIIFCCDRYCLLQEFLFEDVDVGLFTAKSCHGIDPDPLIIKIHKRQRRRIEFEGFALRVVGGGSEKMCLSQALYLSVKAWIVTVDGEHLFFDSIEDISIQIPRPKGHKAILRATIDDLVAESIVKDITRVECCV